MKVALFMEVWLRDDGLNMDGRLGTFGERIPGDVRFRFYGRDTSLLAVGLLGLDW